MKTCGECRWLTHWPWSYGECAYPLPVWVPNEMASGDIQAFDVVDCLCWEQEEKEAQA